MSGKVFSPTVTSDKPVQCLSCGQNRTRREMFHVSNSGATGICYSCKALQGNVEKPYHDWWTQDREAHRG